MIGYIIVGGLGLLLLAKHSNGQTAQQSAQTGLQPKALPQIRFSVPVTGPRIAGVENQIEAGVNAQVTASVPWQPATTLVPTYDGSELAVPIIQTGVIKPTTSIPVTTDLPLAVPTLNGIGYVQDQGPLPMPNQKFPSSQLLPFDEFLEGPVVS